jgi:alkanesulfonate monooxygenase SsuD/methylene tetrahydromethanopterin reductase-like flavin-dependent oxidoreductase (luciferase family)
MRIGLINELHGTQTESGPQLSWADLRDRAVAAERAGFDTFIYEDALMYGEGDDAVGVWESMTVSGALAVATSRIAFGQSVINSPYRNPALLASMAETLNEISGGRYVLGIGAGNTNDYAAFGFPSDLRYSRFEQAIPIIHDLLRSQASTRQGELNETEDARLVLRGPVDVPILIAASGSKMLRLVATYADVWNWWTYDLQPADAIEKIAPLIAELDAACLEVGREPASLGRSLDIYSVVAPGFEVGEIADSENPIAGSAGELATALLEFESVGVTEVRCNVLPQTVQAIEAMAEVVDRVHSA